jgi:hypothetical protein
MQAKGGSEESQLHIPSRLLLDVGVPLVRGYVENAIWLRVIDPAGKDETQLRKDILDFLERLSKSSRFFWSIDHMGELLGEARRYARAGKAQMACLLYATWLEHWLNSLVADLARRRRFHDTEISALLRDVPYKAKPTWLLRLLGFPPLSEKHVRSIVEIGEIRNSFVHYKWRLHDVDSDELKKEGERARRVAEQAEHAIRYLRSVETKYFLGGKKPLRFLTKKFLRQSLAAERRRSAELRCA